MTKKIAAISINYIQDGWPKSETFDVEELEEHGVNFNNIIKSYLADDAEHLTIVIETED